MINNNQLQSAESLLLPLYQKNKQQGDVNLLLSLIGIKVGAFEKVLPLLTSCIQLLPQNPVPLLQRAQIYSQLSLFKQSKIDYQTLIKNFPHWVAGLFSYAGFLQAEGDTSEAEVYLNKVLNQAPDHAGAYLALSGLLDCSLNAPLVEGMKLSLNKYLSSEQNNRIDKMKLYYALGKSMSDCKEYKQAFDYWKKANAIQLTQCSFRVKQMIPFYDALKQNYSLISKEILPKGMIGGRDTIPIFIVGMPRSGSTLLEQMLTSHSQIETVGEVDYISKEVVFELQKMTKKQYPLDISELTEMQLNSLSDIYFKKLKSHYPNAKYIIDKMPANFQSVGLIKKILPNAIVINIKRHPKAILLSVFRNYFAENEPYFCDLNEFNDYYEAYNQLMFFWNELYKDEIIEISYESLIEKPQESITKILNHCNLSWEKECLKFYENTVRVKTLSDQQVNKPLYRQSINEWKHYQTFIKESIT